MLAIFCFSCWRSKLASNQEWRETHYTFLFNSMVLSKYNTSIIIVGEGREWMHKYGCFLEIFTTAVCLDGCQQANTCFFRFIFLFNMMVFPLGETSQSVDDLFPDKLRLTEKGGGKGTHTSEKETFEGSASRNQSVR